MWRAHWGWHFLSEVKLPANIGGITHSAFDSCKSLTTVTIPDGVYGIDDFAFWKCSNLSSIVLPASITSIGSHTFKDCDKLTDVYYGGTEAQRAELVISSSYNEDLCNATWHYASDPVLAQPTSATVMVNGEAVTFEAYSIHDNNYFKLRDIAAILSGSAKEFDVTWSAEKGIQLISGQSYTTVGGELVTGDGTAKSYVSNNQSIYLDGVLVDLTAYTINNNNFFMLRDLGAAFDFNVSWDGTQNMIVVSSDESYQADT